MKLLFSKTIKRIRFEAAIDWQIGICIAIGNVAWLCGDEVAYLHIEILCFNIRIALLKRCYKINV